MFQSASLAPAPAPDSTYAEAPSRSAEKFVLRIPVELNQAMHGIARRHFRSYNSEVNLAVLSELEAHRRLVTMRDLLVSRLGNRIGQQVLDEITRIDGSKGPQHKSNIRFTDGLRDQLKESSSTSMRDMVASACVNWVYYNYQIDALLARCDDPDIQFPTPHHQSSRPL